MRAHGSCDIMADRINNTINIRINNRLTQKVKNSVRLPVSCSDRMTERPNYDSKDAFH